MSSHENLSSPSIRDSRFEVDISERLKAFDSIPAGDDYEEAWNKLIEDACILDALLSMLRIWDALVGLSKPGGGDKLSQLAKELNIDIAIISNCTGLRV